MWVSKLLKIFDGFLSFPCKNPSDTVGEVPGQVGEDFAGQQAEEFGLLVHHLHGVLGFPPQEAGVCGGAADRVVSAEIALAQDDLQAAEGLFRLSGE